MSALGRPCTNPRCSEYDSTSYSQNSNSTSSYKADATQKWVGYGKCYACSQINESQTVYVEGHSDSYASVSELPEAVEPYPMISRTRKENYPNPPPYVEERAMPAALRTDFADGRDRHDNVWMQAVLIGRIYGPSAIEMVIWVLSVVLALGASSVMYYYIAAREDSTKAQSRPSTLTFIVACTIYTLATLPHIQAQRVNRYQSQFYLASLCGLAVTGFLSGWNTAVDIAPPDLTITLVLSSAFHAIYPQKQHGRTLMAEKRDQKLHSLLLPK
ncbi:hypothetical protein BR93DRAFT_932534 [Coniochaeta sp. PMI_546]|nr:hypothetical protein BR93DRAFT_932534 [Coniochaeta sp. PMI_546]